MPGLFKSPKPPAIPKAPEPEKGSELTSEAKKSTAEDRKRQQRRSRVIVDDTETLG